MVFLRVFLFPVDVGGKRHPADPIQDFQKWNGAQEKNSCLPIGKRREDLCFQSLRQEDAAVSMQTFRSLDQTVVALQFCQMRVFVGVQNQ